MKKKALVIVESPTKTRTISKYLGSSYTIASSMGHVRDLNPNILSIDIKNHYKPHYEVLRDKKETIERLRKMAAQSEMVLLGPDPDREGEAIAFHLKEILKDVNQQIFRISFSAITRKTVLAAIDQPQEIDDNKVNSQQMRRILDRLAGYKISPILQRKIGGRLSAGRVQSVALKLIVEREKEIEAFVAEEFWTVQVELFGSREPGFSAKLEKKAAKKITIKNETENEKVLADLKQNSYVLEKINKKKKSRRPLPPLITSSLQQEAFRRFRFPVKKTMKTAQGLYEGVAIGGAEASGLITYMRTDSYRLSGEAQTAARTYITDRYGTDHIPPNPPAYKKKAAVQDAHECIRPTLPLRPPETVKDVLNKDQFRLYELIWKRFLASQMKNAQLDETTFEVKNGEYLFVTKGEVLKFKGYLAVLNEKEESTILPELSENETLTLKKLNNKQNFTKPPPRYNEASLVKILEDKGIGRPSTYAQIIDTLGRREYVTRKERKFVPSNLGFHVSDYLENNFKTIMNYDFTAKLEIQLDRVSEGKLQWEQGIDGFYKILEEDLEKAKKKERTPLTIGKKCPRCQKELVNKYSYKTNGWFVGCSGFPTCKFTEKTVSDIDAPKEPQPTDQKCPECGKPLIQRYSPKTKKHFLGCSGYPACNYIHNQKDSLGPCPHCQKQLVRKFSPKTRRFFVACSGYPDCRFIQK